MITRAKRGIFKPKIYTTSLNFSEPETYEQAITHPKWRKAMQEEYNALIENNTWTLTTLPENKTTVGCKWTFKVKRNPDGTAGQHKARLVAKGYT